MQNARDLARIEAHRHSVFARAIENRRYFAIAAHPARVIFRARLPGLCFK
jgi:hypothetical protein